MLDDTRPLDQQGWSERAVRWWAEHRLRRSVARDLENNTLHGAVRQLIRAGIADYRGADRRASDLGIQLVFQQRELGDGRVAEDRRDARR